MNEADAEMPRYRSHKEVWALKIKSIAFDRDEAAKTNRETTGGATITPADAGFAPFPVDAEWVSKRLPKNWTPELGGYYVVYRDDYKSWSPVSEFEDGYTRI